MLPGSKLTPEDVVAIAARRYWLLLVPLGLAAATAAVVARVMPDSYRSTVTIQVAPQQVPEDYVRSTVTQSVIDQLNSINATIQSRTNLERIITDLNLYTVERRTGIMEDIVERMRGDIKVNPGDGSIFTISYVGRNPRSVKEVADRLASLFIDQNLRERQQQAEGTDQFLDSQLEDARRQLADNEQKVAAYRTQHAGELPSQLQANLSGIQSTQLQIQSTVNSVNQDRERRLVLERELKDLEAAAPNPDAGLSPVTMDASGQMSGGTAAQQLAAAKNNLAIMQTQLHYLDNHPQVKAQKTLIAELQQKADAEALARPVSTDDTAAMPPAERARRLRIRDVQAQMDLIDRSIAQKLEEEKRLRGVSATYQQRAEAAPTRETEMIQLTRDYGTTQTLYTGLLAKKQESKIAANLERRQIGEQFNVLDQARLPERPFSPDRPRITLYGVGIGLAIGLALIVFFEYIDKSFKIDSEITTLLDLPVLAAVPLMRSAVERRRRLRRQIILNAGLASVVLACAGVVAYAFLR
jgi:polysaccharide chain length determinant protein (PEP-CTERM system associated)